MAQPNQKPTTAIAVTEKIVGQYVQDTLPALIKAYAVRDYNGPAWMKTAALCIVENPDLMECLQTEAGRISLKHALRFAATTGLSLNPQEGKAALVPIDGKINYWPMKNGLVDLVLDTGAVARVRMNAVRSEDHFTIRETMDGDTYEFSPNTRKRGEIIGFFCAIKLKSGPSLVEYMTREEMEEHKKKYGKGLSKEGSAWNTSFEGMGIAKVTKRATKRLALPPFKDKAGKEVKLEDIIDGEAEPVQFEEVQTKGASATDVESRLAKAQAEVVTSGGAVQQAEIEARQTMGTTSGEIPGNATPAGAQGSSPSTPEAGGTGDQGKLEIF